MKRIFKSKLLTIVILALILSFFVFRFPSLIGYYFDPSTGIYFKYPEGFTVQKDGLNRINIIVNYRPKGMVYDFAAVIISRGRADDPYQLFGMSSLGLNVDPKDIKMSEIKINNKPAKEYSYGYENSSGEILIISPLITVRYRLRDGQAHIPHSFVENLVKVPYVLR